MNGAESLVRTLVDGGVEVCFANPGTTELPMVRALDSVRGLRPVLGLFEGVCTGAADGYGRMTGRPAVTVLHLGPGLANGLANLHNARRARTPVLNLVGDQATYHRPYDAPLTSDIASLAAPVSGWLRETTSAGSLAGDAAEGLAAACAGQVATLVVPSDCQWDDGADPAAALPVPAAEPVTDEVVDGIARLLRTGTQGTLLVGGPALSAPGMAAAGRIAQATGWRLVHETLAARMDRAPTLPAAARLPYFPEQAVDALQGRPHLVLAGADAPVAFFAYPGLPSSLVPDGVTVQPLARPDQDAGGALERLADELGAPPWQGEPRPAPPVPTGRLDPETLCAALAALQPEGAIVVDESVTTGMGYPALAAGSPPHTYLGHVGGAIGQGLPLAVGAAVAAPDRPVIALQADGSAAYTLQALWTQAREGLDVTTLICANRSYRILQAELARAGVTEPGLVSHGLTDLGGPDLDWVRLAEAQGVPATRATTADELVAQLRAALDEPGPHLIEAVL